MVGLDSQKLVALEINTTFDQHIDRILSIDLFVEIVAKIELPGMDRTGSVALFVEEAQPQLDDFHAIDVALEDGVLVFGLSIEDARRKAQDAWKLSVQSDVRILGHDATNHLHLVFQIVAENILNSIGRLAVG